MCRCGKKSTGIISNNAGGDIKHLSIEALSKLSATRTKMTVTALGNNLKLKLKEGGELLLHTITIIFICHRFFNRKKKQGNATEENCIIISR